MNFGNEHGRITVYILVIIFFVMIVIMGKYLVVSNELERERGLLNRARSVESVEHDEVAEEPEEKFEDVEFEDYVVGTGDIPIYNGEAFLYFSEYIEEKESPEYYIYQEDCVFVGGRNKDYVLMSDIYIDEDKDEFERKNKLVDKIDFNNHRINLRDGDFIFE